MIVHTDPQGSPEWLAARRGCITASRFAVCRERTAKGLPSKAHLDYAMDVARERVGGTAPSKFVTPAMRIGTAEEPVARMRVERESGLLIEEAGFITTDDGKFGGSVDGLIDDDGVWECKTLVASSTLFDALVDGDISAYVDQCMGNLWLLGRKYALLTLWCPDLDLISSIRIERDDDAIHELEADLIAFERRVTDFERRLRAKLTGATPAAPTAAPTPQAAPAARAPAALPASIFD